MRNNTQHISEILPAVCKEHGITMNQGKEMSDAKKEIGPKVREALNRTTDGIIETLREREKRGALKCHLDFLLGAAAALHALDMELWGGDIDGMRTCPPVFFFSWRYDNAEEFLANWDKHHNPETKEDQ